MQTEPASGRLTSASAALPGTATSAGRCAAVLLLGALNVFAFAPFGIWPLQIACVALLFALVMRAPSLRQAALLGWLYSFAWTCAGVYWLYISLHDLGGMPAWLTVLAIALLALGLGLIVGAATGGARWLQARWQAAPTPTLLLILPALWTLAEWTRSWIFTGFPWLSTGLAHTDSPLAGFAPLIGVYGIGWVAALVAAALALLILPAGMWATRSHVGTASPAAAQERPDLQAHSRLPISPDSHAHRHAPHHHRRRLFAVALAIALLACGQALRTISWTQPTGKAISVRLLQGNIPQEMKFDRDQLMSTLGLYEAMITQTPADLIVTPETAVPVTQQQLPPDYLQHLARFAKASGSQVLVGIPISDSPTQYTNGLIVLDSVPAAPTRLPVPIAAVPQTYRYDKHHLVPFGEFIPTGFRWFVDYLQMPLGDQNRGALLQPPFAVRDQWILPNICYEDLFGEEIAAQMRERLAARAPLPTMLLNISNIAWFGDSIAVPQHLQISRMRSLETGRPMLRATNTGATAVIDSHGRVVAALAPYTRGVLSATVQGYGGTTPYILAGNAIIVTLTLLSLLGAAWQARRRHFTTETR